MGVLCGCSFVRLDLLWFDALFGAGMAFCRWSNPLFTQAEGKHWDSSSRFACVIVVFLVLRRR
jgi:hypothetical protein